MSDMADAIKVSSGYSKPKYNGRLYLGGKPTILQQAEDVNVGEIVITEDGSEWSVVEKKKGSFGHNLLLEDLETHSRGWSYRREYEVKVDEKEQQYKLVEAKSDFVEALKRMDYYMPVKFRCNGSLYEYFNVRINEIDNRVYVDIIESDSNKVNEVRSVSISDLTVGDIVIKPDGTKLEVEMVGHDSSVLFRDEQGKLIPEFGPWYYNVLVQ